MNDSVSGFGDEDLSEIGNSKDNSQIKAKKGKKKKKKKHGANGNTIDEQSVGGSTFNDQSADNSKNSSKLSRPKTRKIKVINL